MRQPEWMTDHSSFNAWRTAFWDTFSYTINGLAPYEEGDRYAGEMTSNLNERDFYGWRVTLQNVETAIVIFAQRVVNPRYDASDNQSWNVALGETYAFAAVEVGQWLTPRLLKNPAAVPR
jgi:hypothetical protein